MCARWLAVAADACCVPGGSSRAPCRTWVPRAWAHLEPEGGQHDLIRRLDRVAQAHEAAHAAPALHTGRSAEHRTTTEPLLEHSRTHCHPATPSAGGAGAACFPPAFASPCGRRCVALRSVHAHLGMLRLVSEHPHWITLHSVQRGLTSGCCVWSVNTLNARRVLLTHSAGDPASGVASYVTTCSTPAVARCGELMRSLRRRTAVPAERMQLRHQRHCGAEAAQQVERETIPCLPPSSVGISVAHAHDQHPGRPRRAQPRCNAQHTFSPSRTPRGRSRARQGSLASQRAHLTFQNAEGSKPGTPGKPRMGADAATAPVTRCGYLMRNHAASSPPYDPPNTITALRGARAQGRRPRVSVHRRRGPRRCRRQSPACTRGAQRPEACFVVRAPPSPSAASRSSPVLSPGRLVLDAPQHSGVVGQRLARRQVRRVHPPAVAPKRLALAVVAVLRAGRPRSRHCVSGGAASVMSARATQSCGGPCATCVLSVHRWRRHSRLLQRWWALA